MGVKGYRTEVALAQIQHPAFVVGAPAKLIVEVRAEQPSSLRS